MFLRTLYGSRMPQARHPRVDESANAYWQDDTDSARALAQIMSELDDDAKEAMAMKKKAEAPLPVVVAGEDGAGLRSSRRISLTLPSLIASMGLDASGAPARGSQPLDSMDGVTLESLDSASPIHAQLSPTGLISIAAADIDDATRQDSLPTTTSSGEIDAAAVAAIRRELSASMSLSSGQSDGSRSRNAFLENVIARALGGSSIVATSSSDESPESRLRFLSLLRRINELRSQQVQTDADLWDGLPYPQIMALPTFKYKARSSSPTAQVVEGETGSQSVEREIKNNTMCAVCFTEYAPDEEVRALPCLHFYHRECIDQWLMNRRNCPVCMHVVAVF